MILSSIFACDFKTWMCLPVSYGLGSFLRIYGLVHCVYFATRLGGCAPVTEGVGLGDGCVSPPGLFKHSYLLHFFFKTDCAVWLYFDCDYHLCVCVCVCVYGGGDDGCLACVGRVWAVGGVPSVTTFYLLSGGIYHLSVCAVEAIQTCRTPTIAEVKKTDFKTILS